MENTAFLEELKALTSNEDILAVSREVAELSAHFEDYMIEAERQLQVAQLEAREKGEEEPENPDLIELKQAFQSELREYRDKKRAMLDAKNAEEETNLIKKKELINRLRHIIQHEENIGAAFGALKEIQEKWKEIGDIPRQKRDEVQSDYSKLIEDFFYNINIYKQLKEHDLHRNTQLKQVVVEKLKALDAIESIKEVEHELKALQHEWEDIGPVTNEDWEALKESYWTAVRQCYTRINGFYEERRSVLHDNLVKKQELLQKTTELVNGLPEHMDQKTWDHKTNDILQLQEDWKKIGFGPKKENEEVWKEFRAQCDIFFAKKKEFYGELQHEFDAVAEEKKKLIDQARELKDSTDWKETAHQFVNLQKQWKRLGNAGQRYEQKLWRQFRGLCDEFFDSRQKHFEEMDAAFEDNLTKKKELVAKVEAYQIPDDKKQALADLKAFSEEFTAIGKVPMKEKDVVYNAYKKALDTHYASLKLEGDEKNKIMFQARIDTLAGSPDSARLFAREKSDLRKRIDQLRSDIIQFENNLGFFANSKGADALKKDVEKKVEKAREEIEAIKLKIKMIPNE